MLWNLKYKLITFHCSQTHIPWCDIHEHIAAIG